jgi:DNA-3-methyladenine glycosylase
MFGPAGYAYVYVSYGMHHCLNVVTDQGGTAGAVLIRALQPLSGLDIMRQNRGVEREIDLCNGPGKLCQALAITLEDNGDDLEGDRLWLEAGSQDGIEIAVSTRVGLSRGVERQLRFFVSGSPYVSRGKPSTAREGLSGHPGD